MTSSEQLWQRSELLGTQVITRDTGRRLGIVSEILVDVGRGDVVALGLRDNIVTRLFPGVARYLYLTSVRQIGDVILVDSDEALEDIDPTPYSLMVNSEVITESGEALGRVRGFKFNVETGELVTLVIGSFGLPLIPEQVISTYELPVTEIVSSGPDRIIVLEGSEEKLLQISVGVLERLGISAPPWERDDYSLPVVPATNQLPSGMPVRNTAPVSLNNPTQVSKPKPQATWTEDDNGEYEPIERPQSQAQPRYLERQLDEDDWTDAPAPRRRFDYDDEPSRPAEPGDDYWEEGASKPDAKPRYDDEDD